MDLDLSDDQVALRDGIRSVLAGRFDIDRVRAGFDRAMYNELGKAGVFSLIADGFCWADAAIVFEQLGEFCIPGPLVASLLTGCVATIVGPTDNVVEHLTSVDTVVLLGEDVRRIDASTLSGRESEWPLDPLTPVFAMQSGWSRTAVVDESLNAHELHQRGAVLTAAFALGMASKLTEMSVAYAKEREQFDRPIGSFQAIKHVLADMAVRVELARAGVYAAAAHLDEPDQPGLARTVSVAKTMAGEAAVLNGKAATQVHGGMGFTWEVDVHLYLKRAWVIDTQFGSVDEHCDAITASIG